MEYILSSVFGQASSRGGPLLGLLVVLAFAGIVLLAYYLKTRIDLMRQEAGAAEAERARAAGERAQETAKRDAERREVLAMLEKQNGQIQAQVAETQKMLGNHLAHDEASRERLIETLGKMGAAMDTLADDLKAHRTEESARAKDVYEKLGSIAVGIAGIKL